MNELKSGGTTKESSTRAIEHHTQIQTKNNLTIAGEEGQKH